MSRLIPTRKGRPGELDSVKGKKLCGNFAESGEWSGEWPVGAAVQCRIVHSCGRRFPLNDFLRGQQDFHAKILGFKKHGFVCPRLLACHKMFFHGSTFLGVFAVMALLLYITRFNLWLVSVCRLIFFSSSFHFFELLVSQQESALETNKRQTCTQEAIIYFIFR